MDLENLMIWYLYNEDGTFARISRLMAIPADKNLDAYFEKYMEPPFSGGGITEIKKEWIVVPPHLMNVEGLAYVLYSGDRRWAAVLPYYVLVKED